MKNKIKNLIYDIIKIVFIFILFGNNIAVFVDNKNTASGTIWGTLSLFATIWIFFEITSIIKEKDSEINYLKDKIEELRAENKKLKVKDRLEK